MPFLLADCNNYYVSRERIFDPALLGRREPEGQNEDVSLGRCIDGP